MSRLTGHDLKLVFAHVASTGENFHLRRRAGKVGFELTVAWYTSHAWSLGATVRNIPSLFAANPYPQDTGSRDVVGGPDPGSWERTAIALHAAYDLHQALTVKYMPSRPQERLWTADIGDENQIACPTFHKLLREITRP